MSSTTRETQFETIDERRRAGGDCARASADSARASTESAASRQGVGLRLFIVSDCSDFRPPFSAGGTERQLSALTRELERCGAEVTVMVRACKEEASPEELSRESMPRTWYVPPGPVPKGTGWVALGPNLRFIAHTFRTLLRARRKYDGVIVSGFRQLALPAALVARMAGKRCVLRIEAAWDLNDELSAGSSARIGAAARLCAGLAIRATRRLAFRLTDLVVAFSGPVAARLVELGAPANKIRQVPNGVDVERFAPVPAPRKAQLRTLLDLPQDRTIFIYTGRICSPKGVLDLLQVWERLVGRKDVCLLLAGTGAHTYGNCEAEVQAMASRHPGAVIWRGAVDNVAEYLQAADVFVFLSHFEAFSLSVLEASATGLPCIVSDVSGVRQLVRHHEDGAIVPVRARPEVIVSEIEWLESHRESWPAMGARLRERVVMDYTLEVVARRYMALFQAQRPRARIGPRQSA